MKKKYIRLNVDDKHLSIGNLCRIIKNLAINKAGALQSEIFCVLFSLDQVNETTINNYCIGCRSINSDYKQVYINYWKKKDKDKDVLLEVIFNIVIILEGQFISITNDIEKKKFINKNNLFRNLCNKLYNLAKNDSQVTGEFSLEVQDMLREEKYDEAFEKMLFFIVLDKVQPIYEDDLKKEAIENILENSNISALELEEFLILKFRDSTNYDYAIKRLAMKGNSYACYELGTQEYYGYIASYPRYDISYNYLKVAASNGHPSANYLIASMFLKKKIGSGKKEELEIAYEYLKVAVKLGSVEALNTIGYMYLEGIYPLEKDKIQAEKYFKEASKYDYAYAFNNLGKMKEEEENYKEAFDYYLKSANLGESWACNKVGEYYRKGIGNKKDFKLAFDYYNKALDCNYRNICYYAKYNLAKYFYLDGCVDVVLVKDRELAIRYFEEASREGIMVASMELIYIYSEKYLETWEEEIINKINYYVRLVEQSPEYNIEIKNEIEGNLRRIRDKKRINKDIIKNSMQ